MSDAEIERLVQGAAQKGEELSKLLSSLSARKSLMHNLLTRKTIDHLVEIALGHEELIMQPQDEKAEVNEDAT